MKRLLIILFALMSFVLLSNCSDNAVGSGICSSDADCTQGHCQDGKCVGGCRTSADCPSGGICLDGVCQSNGCDNSAQCKNGFVCKNHKCLPCTADSECLDGHICVSGQCTKGNCHGPHDKSCPDGQICKEHQCSGCAEDLECGEGMLCVNQKCIKGTCRSSKDCKDGKVCKSYNCQACTDKSECEPNHVCIKGVCKEGDCLTNKDCTNGQVCKNNKCQNCMADTDCSVGQICDDMKKLCRAGCRKDNDCPPNQRCDTTDFVCKGCLTNKDCPQGQVCKSGQCSSCTDHTDCTDNKICLNGICKEGCLSNKNCAGGKVCKNHKCQDCADDADCDPDTICDPSTKRCRRGCKSDADCPTDKKHCDPQSKLCLECLENAHCIGGQICRQNKCVNCSKDTDCKKGDICDDTNKVCRAGCRKDVDCSVGQHCDPKAFLCFECVDNSHCTNGKVCKNHKCDDCASDADCSNNLHCAKRDKRCHECTDTSHCSNGKVCLADNTCGPCTKDSQCGQGKLCNQNTGRCTAGNCRKDSDCKGQNICKQYQCVACPKLNIQLNNNAEGLVGRPLILSFSLPQNALPTPVNWKLSKGPSWMKLHKDNDFQAHIAGLPQKDGDVSITLSLTASNCKLEQKFTIKIWPKLVSLVKTYLKGKDGLKVFQKSVTVKGGKPPYYCGRETVAGRGTMPSGVSFDPNDRNNIKQVGCTLKGTPDNNNKPGVYGFLVAIQDSFGQRINIPVGYTYKNCNDNVLTITPPLTAVPVKKTGSVYQWHLDIKVPNYKTSAYSCRYEVRLLMSLGPLSSNGNLSCIGAMPVCVDCNGLNYCTKSVPTCPGTVELFHDLQVRAHRPIRATYPKGPSFQTFEPRYQWRYDNDPNHFHSRTCHWDVLEVN